MSRNYSAFFLISIIAGTLGGILSPFLFVEKTVLADMRFPSVSTAEEFRLVDAQGRMRALLAFSADGEPYLALLDQHETRKVWLGLSKESGLAIRDIDGETRLVLSLDRKGEPTLVLSDRQQNTRALSSVGQEAAP
ncbi:MAG TPA: hypothetical protein VJV04_01445 [Nitrospiraceae bacterium]|nr:hypothetical protein [Nitrospiraceae bacterium]